MGIASWTNNTTAPLGVSSTSSPTSTTTNFLRTPTGQFLGQSSSSGTYYPITNSLGSVVGLTNSSGAIAQSYQYSPYGRVVSSSGNTPSLFGFAGGVNVPGAGGLVHFGARFYNPSVGSWTQLDPSGQSAGYQYAGDNPVNYIDGSGLNWWSAWGAGVAAQTLVGLTCVGFVLGGGPFGAIACGYAEGIAVFATNYAVSHPRNWG